MSGELHRIEAFLATQIGLDPKSVGSRLILRAAQHRMSELDLNDLGEYERRLYDSKQEIQSLAEQVVVPESWFFRDARPYQWFCEYVRQRWLEHPAHLPLRVLSLACAGGEEPYSIAMILSDLGLATSRFLIDAVDISRRRLAQARQGVFSANAFRGRDLSYRLRFFREHPGGFEINPAIRSMVRFWEANVLDREFLDRFSVYDVIFCRNFLIYLHPNARAAVTSQLERLLTADGMLVIGHADRFEWNGGEPRFTAVGEPGCFVYCKTGFGLGRGAGSQSERRPEASDPRPNESFTRGRALVESDSPTTAGSASAIGTMPLPAAANESRSLLSQAAFLANERRYSEAIAACQRDLRLRGPSASAYYLLGVIYQSQDDRRQAEACFHKTVYLDPNHDEALLALALLVEQRGEHKAARGFRRRAARVANVTRNKAT